MGQVRGPLPLLTVYDNEASESDAGEAFSRHGGKVFRYLLRRIGNPHDAEELTQRVFTDITATLARGERPDSMLAWLYAVAERRFTDELRRRARAADISQRAFLDAQSREPSEYGPAVATALREEIERLPVEQGRVVVMKVLEGRSFAEIARAVGATEGACKMRFARGIRQLRDSLRRRGITP